MAKPRDGRIWLQVGKSREDVEPLNVIQVQLGLDCRQNLTSTRLKQAVVNRAGTTVWTQEATHPAAENGLKQLVYLWENEFTTTNVRVCYWYRRDTTTPFKWCRALKVKNLNYWFLPYKIQSKAGVDITGTRRSMWGWKTELTAGKARQMALTSPQNWTERRKPRIAKITQYRHYSARWRSEWKTSMKTAGRKLKNPEKHRQNLYKCFQSRKNGESPITKLKVKISVSYWCKIPRRWKLKTI